MAEVKKVRRTPDQSGKVNPQKKQRPAPVDKSSVARPVIEDVIATKLLRDASLRQKYFLGNRIIILMTLVLFVSILANVFLVTRAPDIRYFATDGEGKIKELISIDEPIQSVNEVLSWTTDAITKAYTFSFANYRQELQSARSNFTSSGWDGFQKALEDSGNLKAVIENMFVTTAVPRGAPVITAEGLINGRYAWKVEVPVIVTYQSANNRTTQDLLVQAIIVRRTELEHPRGLGIAQLIAE